MQSVISSLMALLLATSLLFVCAGLFSTLVVLRFAVRDYPELLTSLLVAIYYVGFIFGAIKCGAVINRIGHIRAFAAFCGGNTIMVLLFTQMDHPLAWLLLRGVMGFNLAGLLMVAESWLNAKATPDIRGTLLSIYMILSYLGLGSGNLLLRVSEVNSDTLFVLGAIGFCSALIPVAVTRAAHPQPLDTSVFSFRHLYEISPLAVLGCLASGLITGALFGMGPIFAQALHFSVADIGIFMAVAVMSGLLLQWPIGRLSDRLDRRAVIIAVAAITGVVGLALMMLAAVINASNLWTPRVGVLFAALTLYGGLSATFYPLCIAYANDYIDAKDVVQASGGLLLAFSIGASIGGIGAAGVMSIVGPGGLFLFSAIVSFLLMLFGLYRTRRRSWAGVIHKEAFVILPEAIATSTIVEIDPRTAGTQLPLELSATKDRSTFSSAGENSVTLDK